MNKKSGSDTFQSEDELIAFINRIVPRGKSPVGIGDDAAVISARGEYVLTTDSLVENVHFRREWITPRYLGFKAVRSNVSDIAAMGAIPLFALVSLVLPSDVHKRSFIKSLYGGLTDAFSAHNTEIIGGNISSGSVLQLTLFLIGKSENRPLLRSGAGVGDSIFCTGSLGVAACEVDDLLAGRKKQMKHISADRITFAHEIAKSKLATACIDISDGLSTDLKRICKASSVGARIYADSIPVEKSHGTSAQRLELALTGGEDYELLFTAKPTGEEIIRNIARQTDTPISRIGETLRNKRRILLINTDGSTRNIRSRGWDHVRGS